MATRSGESEITYIIPGLDSDQAERVVSRRLLTSSRVDAIVIDLATKGVTVHGRALDAVAIRALIESAGYLAA